MDCDCGGSSASTIIAIAAVGAAVAVALAPFLRRPWLSMHEDKTGMHTRLEDNGTVPWLRLVIRNHRLVRAAQSTRVLVESYVENRGHAMPVAMGSPELGWPSTRLEPGRGVVVFAGQSRPLDLGSLERTPIFDPHDPYAREPWRFRIGLAMHGEGVGIGREWLDATPNGYTLRLLLGADDGAATYYDVAVNWDPAAGDPVTALNAVQVEVSKVRWWHAR